VRFTTSPVPELYKATRPKALKSHASQRARGEFVKRTTSGPKSLSAAVSAAQARTGEVEVGGCLLGHHVVVALGRAVLPRAGRAGRHAPRRAARAVAAAAGGGSERAAEGVGRNLQGEAKELRDARREQVAVPPAALARLLHPVGAHARHQRLEPRQRRMPLRQTGPRHRVAFDALSPEPRGSAVATPAQPAPAPPAPPCTKLVARGRGRKGARGGGAGRGGGARRETCVQCHRCSGRRTRRRRAGAAAAAAWGSPARPAPRGARRPRPGGARLSSERQSSQRARDSRGSPRP